jgi:hypothetical protein
MPREVFWTNKGHKGEPSPKKRLHPKPQRSKSPSRIASLQKKHKMKTFLSLQEFANDGGPNHGYHGQGALSQSSNASNKSLWLLLSLHTPSFWLVVTTIDRFSLLFSHATCLLHPLFALAAMPMLLLHDLCHVSLCVLAATHHNYINHNTWDFCN